MIYDLNICSKCKKEFYVREVKYPVREFTDGVICPYCGNVEIPRGSGSRDYDVITKEEYEEQEAIERAERLKRPICPKCKSPMVIKEGVFGKFWGCSKFPHCDGSMSVDDEGEIDEQ